MYYAVELSCCRNDCSGQICLTAEQHTAFRRNHETFQCPFGHRQHFGGESDHERTVRLLREEIYALNREITGDRRERAALLDQYATCPVPHCRGRHYVYTNQWELFRHMDRYHGTMILPAVSLAMAEEEAPVG